MALQDTLCGWGDKEKAAYFLEKADTIVPRRREQIAYLIELLPWPVEAAINVLDLGAGFGAISEQILERFPNATVACVDGSAAMIALGRERLARFGSRARYILADLANDRWHAGIDGPFDAAVSALAIHHLSDDRKRGLYREVLDHLKPGAMFLNNDLVATGSAFAARHEALTLRAIQQQERSMRRSERTLDEIRAEMDRQLKLAGGDHHSHIAPLIDQLRWLREAGFASVDCCWKYLDFAIFGGIKPQ